MQHVKESAQGLVADSFGGQVVETLGIENMIGTPYTEGPKLMQQVENHVRSYPIDIMINQEAVSLNKEQDFINIGLANGISLQAKTGNYCDRCALAFYQCTGRKRV